MFVTSIMVEIHQIFSYFFAAQIISLVMNVYQQNYIETKIKLKSKNE